LIVPSHSRFLCKICLNCRKKGHSVAECRDAASIDNGGVLAGCCFNCGDSSHAYRDCPFPIVNGLFSCLLFQHSIVLIIAFDLDGATYAVCFICKAKGHLSSKCPQNPNGMYPKGGGCRVCGDKYHLAKDCPLKNKRRFRRDESSVSERRGSGTYQHWDDGETQSKEKPKQEERKNKVVRF
jgi:hypothetical protein